MIRKGKALSQERLALRAGLDRTYTSGIERGERNPSPANLLKLADALDVLLSELARRAERLSHGEDTAPDHDAGRPERRSRHGCPAPVEDCAHLHGPAPTLDPHGDRGDVGHFVVDR